MPHPSGQPLSICIVRLSAIGDVCHVTAIVQAIQAHHPDAAITWIIGSIEHTLVSDLPGIEFIVFDKTKGLRAYKNVRQQLGTRPAFDVLLQMQTSLRANLLGKMLNARRKIGLPGGFGRELHSLVVTERVAPSIAFHVLDVFKEFAHTIGVPAFDVAWRIPIPDSDLRAASELVDGESEYILLAPSASHIERVWLPERYAALANYCQSKGMKVVVTGSPAQREIDLASQIGEMADHPIVNVAGKTTLKALLALCKHARLVIGPDSGTLHMATTQQTPAIGLYAHSNPLRTGPYGGLSSVANAYAKIISARGLHNKLQQWGYRLKGAALMEEITLEQVTSLVDEALAHPHVTRPFPLS